MGINPFRAVQWWYKVGKDEVGIAIELTKEILKGVYQMSTLVEKLKKLKKPKDST